MKNLLFFILLAFSFNSNAQTVVELGKYRNMQPAAKFQGISDVQFMILSDGSYRYFVPTGDVLGTIESARTLGITAYEGDLAGMNCLCTGRPQVVKTVQTAELAKIRNLFFGFDSSTLTSESKSHLRTAARILNENPGYSIQFRGYTDSKGSVEYNQALSQRRVNSADSYLRGLGISSNRIRTEAFSENNPIAKNTDSDAGRKFNRRVEIQIFDSNGSALNMVEDIFVPTDLKN